jgi:hypothetical protein
MPLDRVAEISSDLKHGRTANGSGPINSKITILGSLPEDF